MSFWWIRNSIYDSWRILRTEEALKDYNEYISEREEQKKADVKAEPSIGMTADEVRNSSWGEPKKSIKLPMNGGTSEQWVYSLDRYVYLENGRGNSDTRIDRLVYGNCITRCSSFYTVHSIDNSITLCYSECRPTKCYTMEAANRGSANIGCGIRYYENHMGE